MAEEHKPGSMNTTQQEKTFAGFMTLVKWSVIAIVILLVFLAIFRT